MRLVKGLPWALTVCLSVAEAPEGERVALADESGRPLAVLEVTDVYSYDNEREAEQCFRTTDGEHPGVAQLYAQDDSYLAGPVTVFERPEPDFEAIAALQASYELQMDMSSAERLRREHGLTWMG